MIARLRQESFRMDELCGAMEVSRSGYCAHQQKPQGARQKDSVLRLMVAAAFAQSRETCGTPRLLREVVTSQTGESVSRARIGRLLEELGIAPRQKRAFIPRTTVADPAATPAPNLLLNRPPTTGINQVWVTDITYIPTAEGWLYLAAVMDLLPRFAPPFGQPAGWLPPSGRLSRRIQGCATAPHMRAELVPEALQRARFTRSGQQLDGAIAHCFGFASPLRGSLPAGCLPPVGCDRGSQYTSAAWQKSLSLLRVTSSMSRTANCYGNATMESFWASLKAEAIHRIPATRSEARLMIHD